MRILDGHTSWVRAVAFSPDGRTLASASADQSVRLWNLAAEGECRVLTGHDGWAVAVGFAADGNTLASGGHDRAVRLWSVHGGRARRVVPEPSEQPIVTLAYSPTGEYLAYGGYDRKAHLWNVARKTEAHRLSARGLVFTVAFAPDGTTLAAGGSSHSIQFWDVASGKPGRSLSHGDRKGCREVSLSTDGRLLAAALGCGVRLWELRRRRVLATLTDHKDVASAVVFSPDGRLLLTGGWDGTARLYELGPTAAKPRLLSTFQWGMERVFGLAFAPDGLTAAAAGSGNTRLVVWDVV